MESKFNNFADYHGVDPKEAGRVFLSAFEGGEFVELKEDMDILDGHIDILDVIGIEDGDSKEVVRQKLEAAYSTLGEMVSKKSEQIEEGGKADLIENVRGGIKSAITWVQ